MAASLCSIALVLLVDVSSSVNEERWLLQRDGIANALISERVMHAIENAVPIAITEIEWANRQVTVIPWKIIRDKQDVLDLSQQIHSQPSRSDAGNTHMGGALKKAIEALKQAPCDAEKQVIDISGDGATDDEEYVGIDSRDGGTYKPDLYNSNRLIPFSKMHTLAEQSGIQINGLPIWSAQEPTVVQWYQEVVYQFEIINLILRSHYTPN